MSWRPDQVAILIDEYGKYPVLYNPKDLYYTNKKERNKAKHKILEVLKIVRPEADVKDILKKIGSLRNSFSMECTRIANSQQTAQCPEEVYVPKIWYFHKLLYLRKVININCDLESILNRLTVPPDFSQMSSVFCEENYPTEYLEAESSNAEVDPLEHDNIELRDNSPEFDFDDSHLLCDSSIKRELSSVDDENSEASLDHDNSPPIKKRLKPEPIDDLWRELLLKRLECIDQSRKLELQRKIDEVVYEALTKQSKSQKNT